MELAELVKILACPLDRQPIRLEGQQLICTQCDAHYPITDGILELLPESATFPNGRKAAAESHAPNAKP
jgi:uncharacterized protein YbaR (Trm112 family)